MKQSMVLLIGGLTIVIFVLLGCSRQSRQIENHHDESVSVKATLVANCVAYYYKTDASAYITQQKHEYNPINGFFRVTSTEPSGVVQFTLIKEKYKSSDMKEHRLSDLPSSFGNKNLAVGVFYSFCAGGDLLEKGDFIPFENVKLYGQWYRVWRPQWPGKPEVKLLESLDTERIELVRMKDKHAATDWLFEVYNYRYEKGLSGYLPRTIDVFDLQGGLASKELMIRFDYKNIQKVEK